MVLDASILPQVPMSELQSERRTVVPLGVEEEDNQTRQVGRIAGVQRAISSWRYINGFSEASDCDYILIVSYVGTSVGARSRLATRL